jgi:curli biogenesis system outer membrane secretion channel CsgG
MPPGSPERSGSGRSARVHRGGGGAGGTRALAPALLLLGLAACAAAPPSAPPGASAPPPTVTGATPVAAPLPPPRGPKKRVAVAKFDAAGNFLAVYGSWDVGGGLAAQLTTALVDSGHFVVVERAELAGVLREQEMSLQKIVSKDATVQLSRVLGVQLLVKGAVTEFEQKAGGGNLRLGVSGVGSMGGLGGGLGGQSTHGLVALDVRLIDTTTGQVVQSRRAEARVEQRGVSADVNVSQLTLGGEAFDRTVLGQATRKAIEEAVRLIVAAMEPVPWSAAVVDVAGDQIYVNAGRTSGIQRGDVFHVSTVERELTDPASGALLGVIERPLGQIRVESVEERYSVARMAAPFTAKRGDLVKLPRP